MVGIQAEDGAPAWPILICVLGEFRVLKAGRSVELPSGGKAEYLLTCLALGPSTGVSREALLAGLWPNQDPLLASESLNSLIYRLHRLLGDALDGANPVLHAKGRYRLNVEAGVRADTLWIEALAAEGAQLAQAGHQRAAIALYQRAADLYRGHAGAVSDVHTWMEYERLRELCLNLRAGVVQYYFSAEDYTACLDHALALLRHEPCREDIHRIAIRCFVRLGERGKALRQYRLCELALRKDFDAAPEGATVALFDQVRLDPANV
jgi:DNA-binding SARP family transcriptional activator